MLLRVEKNFNWSSKSSLLVSEESQWELLMLKSIEMLISEKD